LAVRRSAETVPIGPAHQVEVAAVDNAKTWDLIHQERSAMADVLAGLAPSEWAKPSLCPRWSVHVMAAHIVAGAEQTPGHFVTRLTANGFRFNTTMDREAQRVGTATPAEIIERLRARTNTTNRPPATVVTMLGEIVVHGEDIRRPLGIAGTTPAGSIAACLDMYVRANFPVGAKKRIAGLHLTASDLDWSYGSGPRVLGPGLTLLMAITGRPVGVDDLDGDGVATLSDRMPPAA
jgi:uncharacterized protein (TIGR03083 family)